MNKILPPVISAVRFPMLPEVRSQQNWKCADRPSSCEDISFIMYINLTDGIFNICACFSKNYYMNDETNLLTAGFNLHSLTRSVYTVQSVATIHPRTWTQTQQMATIVRKSSCSKADKLNEMKRQSFKTSPTKGKHNFV